VVADRLGRAGVRAVVSPRTDGGFGGGPQPDERLNRPNGPSIENAHRLHRHGVPVAVVPISPVIGLWGIAGRDLLHLNMEAAFAVRGGMSNEAALRAITLDAARVLGVDDRVGSLEPGKDADLIVCSGDILHYLTQVHYTIVNGRVAYDKAQDTLYAHIRPEGKLEPVEFDDQWPRPLAWPN
jgi:predicted amidohydrolase YtcJ